jgi:Tfp pilus assembly protein PilP
MALTMMHTKQFALSIALAALVSGGAVSAQINPATAKASAQNAAQTANTSATQSTSSTAKPSQTSATNPKNNMNTSATQTPAKPSQSTSAAKPQAQTKTAPAQTTKEPAKLTPPKDDKKKPPTNAPTGKMAPAQTQRTSTAEKTPSAQKNPPAKEAKPAAEVTKTTKPALPQGRRDPFITLVGKQTGGAGSAPVLPPGKGGLQVSTLILQGIVCGPNGMIAVVANPQKSVYFLRVGDELFDGRVEKIEIGSVHFHEVGKDAFGKPIEREVTRKLNPSSGDQP